MGCVTVLILCLVLLGIKAFPDGAGGCEGQRPAVEGSHLDIDNKSVSVGFLDEVDVTVMIGTTVLDKNSVATLPIGEDLDVVVNSPQFPAKGILVRLERADGVDSTGAIEPGENLKVADVCTSPAVGITHTDSRDKTIMAGVIRYDEAVDRVDADITVVFQNDASSSIFAYDLFLLRFVSDETSSVPTPSTATDAPSEATTLAPFEPEQKTDSPASVPIDPSTLAPTTVPDIPVARPVSPPLTPPAPRPDKPSGDSMSESSSRNIRDSDNSRQMSSKGRFSRSNNKVSASSSKGKKTKKMKRRKTGTMSMTKISVRSRGSSDGKGKGGTSKRRSHSDKRPLSL